MLGLVGRRSISMTFNTDADQQLMLPPLDNAKNHLDQVSLTARLLWEFIVSCHQLLLHTLLHCAPWHSAARTPAISIAHDVTVDPFARWLPAAMLWFLQHACTRRQLEIPPRRNLSALLFDRRDFIVESVRVFFSHGHSEGCNFVHRRAQVS